jgi:hypothetical protein
MPPKRRKMMKYPPRPQQKEGTVLVTLEIYSQEETHNA